MPSFDVVSEADMQEVKNAVEQVRREIETRFDFRGAKATMELEGQIITINVPDQVKRGALEEILKLKLAKRGVGLKCVTFEEPESAGGDRIRQVVKVRAGLEDEELKRLNKLVKSSKIKVTSQIQGEQLRVTGKKRDDLQEMIAVFRAEIKDLELQFTNFRE